MIKSYLLTKLLDELYASIKVKATEKKCSLRIDKNDLEKALNFHTTYIQNWSKDISIEENLDEKPTLKTYIPLDYYVIPRSLELVQAESKNKVKLKLSEVLDNEKNIILIGQPGAGKTTTLQYISQSFFYISDFLTDFNFLIVVRLRDLNHKPSTNIVNELLNILGIFINYNGKSNPKTIMEINKFLLLDVLEKLSPIILFDGFDEIYNEELKQTILFDLDWISLSSCNHKFILTSRTGDVPKGIKNIKIYEVSSLEENQIIQFAERWLKKEDVTDFLLKIRKTPYYDTSIRPLTMSYLCALYERYNTIPSKPKAIYKKIIHLLIEKWDLDRGISRKSNFINFDTDKKFELVSYLAYYLTVEFQSSVFSYDIMEKSYINAAKQIKLPNAKIKLILEELELHSGLILQNTYDTYEFAHKSLQEYLCAEYLIKLPPHKLNVLLIIKIPNELAIAIAISPIYFQYIILNLISKVKLGRSFANIFLNRLLLEEPEFNNSIELGIAFYQLVSISYFSFGLSKKDETYNLLMSLFKQEEITQSIKLIKYFYKVEKNSAFKIDDDFVQISQIKMLKLEGNLYIPDTFVISKDFLWKTEI